MASVVDEQRYRIQTRIRLTNNKRYCGPSHNRKLPETRIERCAEIRQRNPIRKNNKFLRLRMGKMCFSSSGLPLARCIIMRSLLSTDTCRVCSVAADGYSQRCRTHKITFFAWDAHSTRNGWLQVEKPLCDCLSANTSMCVCLYAVHTATTEHSSLFTPKIKSGKFVLFHKKQTHTHKHEVDATFAYVDCESIVLFCEFNTE